MASKVIEIVSRDDFLEKINNTRLTIVDFYADWCGPCRNIAPSYVALSENYSSVNFHKVNVDTAGIDGIMDEYDIRFMPTFLLFKNGKLVARVNGANLGDIINAINNNL